MAQYEYPFIHGPFATLRRALAELEVNEHSRVFSLANLVDGGPRSVDALDSLALNGDAADAAYGSTTGTWRTQ